MARPKSEDPKAPLSLSLPRSVVGQVRAAAADAGYSVSEFMQACFLARIDGQRVSLQGNEQASGAVMLVFEPEQLAELERRAAKNGSTVEESLQRRIVAGLEPPVKAPRVAPTGAPCSSTARPDRSKDQVPNFSKKPK